MNTSITCATPWGVIFPQFLWIVQFTGSDTLYHKGTMLVLLLIIGLAKCSPKYRPYLITNQLGPDAITRETGRHLGDCSRQVHIITSKDTAQSCYLQDEMSHSPCAFGYFTLRAKQLQRMRLYFQSNLLFILLYVATIKDFCALS